MNASPGFFRRGTGLFILWPGLFILWPGFFILEGLAVQNHRGSVMVDFPHLKLFHGVGRGGHRHDDTPVTVEVMGVNILQVSHEFRQHGGHLWFSLPSSLPRRVWTKSISPDRKNLVHVGNKSTEIRVKKRAIIPQISAMGRTLRASRSRSTTGCGRT